MRNGGQGSICTLCGKSLLPTEATKVKFTRLSNDKKKASTGVYDVIGKMDLCIDCYNTVFSRVVEEPRK